MAQAQGVKTGDGPSLRAKGLGPITTEIRPTPAFHYAEAEHQHYLAKDPDDFCAPGGTGVTCPVALAA